MYENFTANAIYEIFMDDIDEDHTAKNVQSDLDPHYPPHDTDL